MTQVQTPAPTWRQVRGIVLLRMASGVFRSLLVRDERPPPFGALEWSDGERWRRDFDGRWLERGDGNIFWEWQA